MKQHLPYNILLILALAVTGLMVFYNYALRENFAVYVGYEYPNPDPQSEPEQVLPTFAEDFNEEPEYEYDDYAAQTAETVVLVTFPLELNSATVDELMYIPQIGSVTAQRITQYREQIGGFTDLAQLKEISGIGDKTFEIIEPYLYLEGEWSPDLETEEDGEDTE